MNFTTTDLPSLLSRFWALGPLILVGRTFPSSSSRTAWHVGLGRRAVGVAIVAVLGCDGTGPFWGPRAAVNWLARIIFVWCLIAVSEGNGFFTVLYSLV